MKTATVTGAGGFIGHHLVKHLKDKGYYVIGIDKKEPEFQKTKADEFRLLDLRNKKDSRLALLHFPKDEGSDRGVSVHRRPVDEVYHLAADMGGMGFIHNAECEIMRNSALININMIHSASELMVGRFFFSSSVCVYPNLPMGAKIMTEEDAYPALPDNEYGWEKLYAERLFQSYERNHDMTIRIARFQNCYGPLGTWDGGREKAPAAICRKISLAEDGGTIEVWGDGTAMRSYTYVDDMVKGIYALMHSDITGPVNIGDHEYYSVKQLVNIVAKVAGKRIKMRYIDGPVGVQNRNFSNGKIWSTEWKADTRLKDGIKTTYEWIAKQAQIKKNKDKLLTKH